MKVLNQVVLFSALVMSSVFVSAPTAYGDAGDRIVVVDAKKLDGAYDALLPKLDALDEAIPGLKQELMMAIDVDPANGFKKTWILSSDHYGADPILQYRQSVFIDLQRFKKLTLQERRKVYFRELVRGMTQRHFNTSTIGLTKLDAKKVEKIQDQITDRLTQLFFTHDSKKESGESLARAATLIMKEIDTQGLPEVYAKYVHNFGFVSKAEMSHQAVAMKLDDILKICLDSKNGPDFISRIQRNYIPAEILNGKFKNFNESAFDNESRAYYLKSQQKYEAAISFVEAVIEYGKTRNSDLAGAVTQSCKDLNFDQINWIMSLSSGVGRTDSPVEKSLDDLERFVSQVNQMGATPQDPTAVSQKANDLLVGKLDLKQETIQLFPATDSSRGSQAR